jgi:PTH1 family peptidyl-tRNA hydrolase
MMNASGYAVAKLLSNLAIKQLSDLWVVHDDLDLPLGKIKIRIGGGTAGHRGLESIVEEIGSADFVRFRLGIGHPGVADDDKHKEVERYVLESFSGEERHEASRMVKRATEAIKLALDEGIEAAMNKFNLK